MAKQRERLFKCSELLNTYLPFFAKMKTQNEFCDITIHAGNTSIAAHRLILSAGIPYFRNEISSNNEIKDIEVENIEPDLLKCLINYAYTFEVNIDEINVQDLLKASCVLNIEEVKGACCYFLAFCLKPESAWSIRELSISIEHQRLLEDTDYYIMENFDVICKTEEFLNYPLNYLRELIDKDYLNVYKEEHVLDAVLQWVKESPDDRKGALPELMQKIRMSLVEHAYLRDIVETEELIRDSDPCRSIIEACPNYHINPETSDEICSGNTQPRRNKKKRFASEEIRNPIILKLEVNETCSIESFHLFENTWTSVNTKPDIRVGPAVNFRNTMYFFHRSVTVRYDPRLKTFSKLNSMLTWREDTAATDLKDTIYICGGTKDFHGALNVVECFVPEKDKWSTGTSMATSRWRLNAVTLGDCIFALGGRCRDTVFDYVERYDPKRDKWTPVSSMLTARHSAGAASLNGKIYVCGGLDTDHDITAKAEVYDPFEDEWTAISSMSAVRSSFTLLSCREKLYAIGGLSYHSNTKHNFDIYDSEKKEWTEGASTSGKYEISGAVVMCSINK